MLALRTLPLYVALLLSGSAALVYQTTWGRMLQRVFGVSDLAVATVLATFFLGLGLGSAAGDRFAKRKPAARTYGLIEIGVGIWAIASLWLMPRIHDAYSLLDLDASFGTLTFVRLLLAFIVLLPPTFLMGATLPVLIAAVSESGLRWERRATWLYATNTLGAALGAAATGLYLVPRFGAQRSVMIAAALSFAAAIVVMGTFRRGPKEAAEPATEEALRRAPSSPRLAMGLAAAAGFASLAGEVLWTRALRLVVQGTTQAFAAMLTVFLVGIGLGSVFAGRLAKRYDPRALFGGLQLTLGVLTLLAMFVASRLPQIVMLLQGELVVVPHEAWVVLAAATVLLFPLALALGTAIPLAWRIAGGSSDEAAKTSGRVLATNTLGGLVGSLLAGFLLVPFLGLERSLGFIAFVHFATATATFVAMATQAAVVRATHFFATAPLLLGAVALAAPPELNLPYLLDAWYDPQAALIEGPQDHWRDPVRLLEEGRNTTVTVLERDSTLRLFNDGRPESGIGTDEPGFGEELSTLGSLPTLFAEPRERAMVIGLGAAHSTAVLLGGPWQDVDVVELEGAVVGAARFLYESRSKAFPLDDERTRLVVDDARAQLVLAPEGSYDAIVSQPSHPWLAGSSALYTREFFQETQGALSEGGVLALWSNLFRMDGVHLQRIVGTLSSVFEHVHAYMCEDSSFILAASDRPIVYGREFAERVASAGLRPFLRPFALDDSVDFLSVVELDSQGAAAFGERAEALVDDRPALEFALARIPQSDGLREPDVDYLLRDIPWMSAQTFEAIDPVQRFDVLLRRLEYVEYRYHAIERVRLALPDLPISATERRTLDGVIAELRGDVRGAIEAFDEAKDDPTARYRLTALLDAERLYGRQIQLQAELGRVESPLMLLRAAMAINNRTAAEHALEAETARNDPSDDAIAAAARAWLANDCPALRASMLDPRVSRDEQLVRAALACAYAAGDAAEAEELGEQLARNRRRVASQEVTLGDEAENAGAGARALRHFLRALKAHPGHAQAATRAAQIRYRLEGEDAARDQLRAALPHTLGLPSAREHIDRMAR
ncbi:MAG: fused MFS/spermidine synthase, partial [Myxococcota bacterium]